MDAEPDKQAVVAALRRARKPVSAASMVNRLQRAGMQRDQAQRSVLRAFDAGLIKLNPSLGLVLP